MRPAQLEKIRPAVVALAAGLLLACGPEATYSQSASAGTLAFAWRGAVIAVRLRDASTQFVVCAPHVACMVLATPPYE